MNKRKTIFWQILPSYWAVILITIITFTTYSYISANRFYATELEHGLSVRASLLQESLVPLIDRNDAEKIDALCKLQSQRSETRFTVISRNGTVLGESDESPALMKNHRERDEISRAMHGETSTAKRYSQTLRQQMMYVAVPLKNNAGQTIAVIRTALPMNAINQIIKENSSRILIAAALICIIAMLLCIAITTRITTPLRNLKTTADRYARGDFDHKAPLSNTEEIHEVSDAMNLMARKLEKRLNTIRKQQNELKATLSGLHEGVITFDNNECILHLNDAAAELLEIDKITATGQTLQEAIRFANLQQFIHRIATTGQQDECELTLHIPAEKRLELYGTPLKRSGNEPLGALIVLRDVTRIKHLESMRKDFVANVSHELRTPITSIKGFVETMLESAEDFGPHARFLGIVSKQTNRLNAIIDDLLTLSRLEQKGVDKNILMKPALIREILSDATDICSAHAQKKAIVIQIECNEHLTAHVNQALLEQALVNLIENAIKYSDENCNILITATDTGTSIQIAIQDQGYGIEPEHQPRLFERFYRVDTARSRKLGGTGLGLAIVKHIINCHSGTIRLSSQLGSGSLFTINLPK